MAEKPKKISKQTISGERGVNLIQRRVLEMEWAWHQTSIDAGIDGLIEIRDPATGAATNLVLQVQSKAVSGAFLRESDETFEYKCDPRDLAYWLGGNAPVLLICSRPASDEAYWISVKEHFSSPARRKEGIARFDKKRDVFDASAMGRLRDLALATDSGLYLPTVPRTEKLISNLLPVVGFAESLWFAPTKLREREKVFERLRELVEHPDGEWVLRGGGILSIHDLDQHPWQDICDFGAIERFDAPEWSESDDPDKLREFVELLNCCLRGLCRRQQVAFEHKRQLYYFWSESDGRTVAFQNRQNRSSRSVVTVYKDNEGGVRYHKHAAFEGRFRRFDGRWFLEVVPTYHYTSNGRETYPWYDRLLRGLKRLENNEAVESQVRLLAHVLAEPEAAQVHLPWHEKYPHLRLGAPIEFELDAGLYDADWLPPPGEAEDEDPLPLLERLP